VGTVFIVVWALIMQKGKGKKLDNKIKLVKISIELGIDDDLSNSKDDIASYLNNKLYTDPEFFGEFGPENIESVMEIDDAD